MAKTIRLEQLGDAIQQELTLYHQNVLDRINKAGDKAVKDLVKQTKSTAPAATGSFRSNIAAKCLRKGPRGNTYAWYVKAPDYRITHLIVHGHATRNGGRTSGNSFLQDALDTVLPAYEEAVKEAVKND